MVSLIDDELRVFAERGYVVIHNVVPHEHVRAAMQCIDDLIDVEPAPPDRRGFHFYWRSGLAPSDPLRSLLIETPAWSIAEALEPLQLVEPDRRKFL